MMLSQKRRGFIISLALCGLMLINSNVRSVLGFTLDFVDYQLKLKLM